MSHPEFWNLRAQVGSGMWCLARVSAPDGNNLLNANCSKIHLLITRAKDQQNALFDGDLSPISDYLSDTLKGTPDNPDPRWKRQTDDPNDGFNFEYWIPHTIFAVADHYRVEFTFTDVAPEKKQWKVVLEGPARSGDETDRTS